MAKKKLAKFTRCAEFRERAGLSVNDLVVALGNKPSKTSINRVEDGYPILASNAFRIANAINKSLGEQGLATFEVDDEVVRVD